MYATCWEKTSSANTWLAVITGCTERNRELKTIATSLHPRDNAPHINEDARPVDLALQPEELLLRYALGLLLHEICSRNENIWLAGPGDGGGSPGADRPWISRSRTEVIRRWELRLLGSTPIT